MLYLFKRIPKKFIFLSVFFAFIQGFFELILPTITASLVDQAIIPRDMSALRFISVKMIIVTLLIVSSAMLNIWFASKASQNLGQDLRNHLYHKVQKLAKDDLDAFGTASLINRSSTDIMQIELTTMMVLRMFLLAPALLLFALIMAIHSSLALSQTYLVTIPIIVISLGVILYFSAPYFRVMQGKLDQMNLIYREGLTGVRVIRAFNKNEYEAERFKASNLDYRDTAIAVNIRIAFLMPILMTTLNLSIVFINWLGAHLVSMQQLDLGAIISFVSYTGIMGVSFQFIALMFVLIPRAQVSAGRIVEVLVTPEKIHSPKSRGYLFSKDEETRLDFNHVNFAYDGAASPVLKDIDFHLTANQSLGIIGGTGSGKSTLANLIFRFYQVKGGKILINNLPIEHYNLKNLRDHIAYVPQKANLFSGTIRSNLAFGKAGASDEEMWRALEIAQANSFVEKLDKGLDSVVEQGGTNFSGGQKQRLCIARALLKDAEILIFDDSFSALDAQTDQKLRQALSETTQGKIILIIAQRVSTIQHADRILVLTDNGAIAGIGRHEELLREVPLYASIVSSQSKEVTE